MLLLSGFRAIITPQSAATVLLFYWQIFPTQASEGGIIGSYIHGSGKRGRTGRAGALVSLVSGKDGDDDKVPLDVSSFRVWDLFEAQVLIL